MSRIRSIHPGFFTDEDLVGVSLAARMLFLGLGVQADDKGIFEWKPRTLKMRIFPADNIDVEGCLDELLLAGCVMEYCVAGKDYGAIKNFRRFQKPKTPNDIYPATPDVLAYVGLEKNQPEPPPFPPKGEKPSAEVSPFPPKGEKSRQMEDGGDKKEKEGRKDARDDAPALSDEVPPDHHDTLAIAQECARAGGVRFVDPGHIPDGVNLIREWQQAGADPPLMLATIRQVVATTKQPRIGSLKFFDGAIRKAIAKQEAQRNGHTHSEPDTLASLALRLAAGGDPAGQDDPLRLGFAG